MGRGGKRRSGRPYSDGPAGGMSKEQARQAMDAEQHLVPFIRGREIDAGDLSGDEVEPIVASFTYFGHRFRVNPDLTETAVVDLLEAGETIAVDDPRQLVAAKDYVREHLHPDDFDEFWSTAVEHRQTVQHVIKVCWRLLEQITERPTSPPSDSSDGRRDTPTNSPAGASVPATGNARDIAAHFVTKYETAGRPDLAAQVMLAVETREARGLVTV